MTRQQLNDSIDAVFDDNIPDNSLTPSMEGTELKKIADYVDQQAPIGTEGSVTGTATAPYPVLDKKINKVSTTAISQIVVLPTTDVIGKEVLVFALNNSSSFSVRGDQGGTSVLSTGGIATTTGSISVGANISVRFIHIGGGFWKAEII